MKHPRVPRTVRRDTGGLLSKHRRYQAFTFFEAESEIRSQVESKTGKKRNGPNRKSNRLTKKKIHIPCATLNYYLGWLMWYKVCTSYEHFYTKNGAAKIQSAVRYFRPNESALYKLCTNINQPYLIWAAVLCRHVPPPKDQGHYYQQSNRPKRGICIVHDVVVAVVADDMELLQRWSPVGRLKLEWIIFSSCLN